ncbi:MAG: Por secretion system C-terminal sorting protein, partial [Candidatus Krumholzibacteriota bacterium]|nr:Por secretion system C-terminal sorting protein [Candidatus Krumholzibacteriota bacterium]
AFRSFLVVHDSATPPYFILIDDIEKDGTPHTYEWRLHTAKNNTIDTATNPIRIAYGAASMQLHVVNPSFSSLQKTVTFFNNLMPEADSNVLSLAVTTVDPFFVFVLVPGDGIVATPTVTSSPETWGFTITIAWPNGKTDVFLVNRSGAPVTHTVTGLASASPQRGAFPSVPASGLADAVLETDAGLALVRFAGAAVERYTLTGVTTFAADGVHYVTINNGPATVGFSGTTINIDRYDADFSIYAPGVTEMYCRDQRIYLLVDENGFVTPDPVTAIPDGKPQTPSLRVRAYPNPFNPTTTLSLELEEAGVVTATLYDAAGRRVRSLWRGPLPAGVHRFDWDGRNDAGAPLASGVYFLSATSGNRSAVVKLVLVR